MARRAATAPFRVLRVETERTRDVEDRVVTEEPLEIRVTAAGVVPVPFTVTMRTPGHDLELAVGLLRAEGVLRGAGGLRRVAYCTDRSIGEQQRYNVVTVELTGPLPEVVTRRARPLTSSACGVCGTTTLDALAVDRETPLAAGPLVETSVIRCLPDRLAEQQRLFAATGGLHAAGLFTPSGEPVVVREDVGRHNAVDKVLGRALLDGLPGSTAVLVVSGRAGFEIVQKALAADIAVVCAVSAPTSLSVDLARRFGMTLVGFTREGRFTVYAGPERIAPSPAHRRG